MFHYFEAITNKKGDSLIGYFARVTDPATGDVVTIAADNSGTPISTVSGVDNMGKTDDAGNLSFYIAAGTYNLNIYAPDAATFISQIPNVGMSQGTDGNDGQSAAIVSVTANTLAPGSLATATNVGTSLAAQFVFGIPAGTPGTNGLDGTTGNHFVGDSVPANNVGVNGDTYTNSVTGVTYDQKTGNTWPLGSVADVNSPWVNYEFRYGANFPSVITVTRASTTTDALYDDPAGRAYTTFANNVPRVRSDKGLGIFQSSRNYLLNSTAPATQTVTLAAGIYILWGNGTGTLTSAAGTAVGSGFGALALNTGVYQTITITTGGTITVTVAGTCNWFQLETNPLALTKPAPTPLIITTGAAVTRDADAVTATGALLSFFQATAGTVIFETMSVKPALSQSNARLLGANNNSGVYVVDQNVTYWGGGSGTAGTIVGATGDSHMFTDRVRTAVGWSGTTTSIGAGTHVPAVGAITYSGGTPPTTVYIGAGSAATNGDNTLNGWLLRLETKPTRATDLDMLNRYTALPQIGPSIIENLTAAKMLKWKGAKREILAGVRDGFIVCVGTSHTAGTNPTSNAKAYSWPALLAAQLTARGIPASDNAVFGNGTQAPNAGVSTYDSRVTFSSGWQAWGTAVQQGLRNATGGTIDYAPTGTTTSITIIYYTNTTYGSIAVSANGGATISTINCAAAASIQSATISTGSGTNTFRLTTTGEVVIAGFYTTNSAAKQFIVINAGIVGAKAAALAQETGSQNSISAVMALVPPDIMFYECVTNDAAAATSQSAFRTSVQYTIGLGKTYGDVVVLSDPASQATGGVAPIAAATQATYTAIELSVALKNDCVIADVYTAMTGGWTTWQNSGYYNGTDQYHLNSAWGYPMYEAVAGGALP